MLPVKESRVKRRRRELRGRKQNAINDNGRVCSLAFFYVLARGLCSIFISFHHGDLPALSPLFYGQPLRSIAGARFIPSPLHLQRPLLSAMAVRALCSDTIIIALMIALEKCFVIDGVGTLSDSLARSLK